MGFDGSCGPHPSGALAYKAHYEKNLTARHDDFRPHIETTKESGRRMTGTPGEQLFTVSM